MKIKTRDIWLAILAAFLWGATFPVTAVALSETPPIFFAFLRFAFAALFVFFVPRPRVPWRYLIAAGLLFGIGQYGLMFLSMTQGIPAGLASLLIHSQAFFTIILAMVIFSERLAGRQILAMVFAIVGFAVLIANNEQTGSLAGFGLILVAAACAAGGNIVLKSLGGADMLGVAVWMSLAAPAPLLALSLLIESDGALTPLIATVSPSVLAAALYSAAIATVFVYTIWGRLFAAYSAATIAPFFLAVPVFGIALSVLLLGERLTVLQMGGAGLIFTGLVLTVRTPSAKPLRQDTKSTP